MCFLPEPFFIFSQIWKPHWELVWLLDPGQPYLSGGERRKEPG